jgi:MFS family permease
VYAVLFTATGLSAAEISSLFIVWSVTAFAAELPSGVLADLFSRRLLVALGPLVTALGFALWVVVPSYPAFAAGFVLWGIGGALVSGALEALVYEELDRAGASASYARVAGRAAAVRTTAYMAATAVAAPVLAAGGYPALGAASVAALLVAAAIGWSFPESRERGRRGGDAAAGGETGGDDEETTAGSYLRVLREGLAEVRASASVRRALLYLAVLMGVTSVDEYLPLLALDTGVGEAAVPLVILLFTAGDAVGGWSAGRGGRWEAAALAGAAVCLAAGALAGTTAAMVLVAAAFGVFRWAIAAAEARLQDRIGDDSRATVSSMAGFASEVAAVAAYASYGLGSAWAGPGPLFAVAAAPYLLLALAHRFGRY